MQRRGTNENYIVYQVKTLAYQRLVTANLDSIDGQSIICVCFVTKRAWTAG